MSKRIKYTCCTFEKSSIEGIFNKTSSSPFQYDFIKFSEPKADYLIKYGTAYVIQSWETENNIRSKTLHTGLIYIGNSEFLFGDNINLSGKKDFLLLRIIKPKKVILYSVKNRNPRNKIKFSHELINQIL